MTDIQASVGVEQLKKLPFIVEERRKIAQKYIEALSDIDRIQLPIEKEGFFSNYQSFSVILKDNCPISRNELMQKLLDRGIATRRGIMTAHRETAYKDSEFYLALPKSEKLADNSILLPLYIPMKEEDVDYIISEIRALLSYS